MLSPLSNSLPPFIQRLLVNRRRVKGGTLFDSSLQDLLCCVRKRPKAHRNHKKKREPPRLIIISTWDLARRMLERPHVMVQRLTSLWSYSHLKERSQSVCSSGVKFHIHCIPLHCLSASTQLLSQRLSPTLATPVVIDLPNNAFASSCPCTASPIINSTKTCRRTLTQC